MHLHLLVNFPSPLLSGYLSFSRFELSHLQSLLFHNRSCGTKYNEVYKVVILLWGFATAELQISGLDYYFSLGLELPLPLLRTFGLLPGSLNVNCSYLPNI